MKLYLENAPRYAAEQIMMMLFQQDKPCVVDDLPSDGDFAHIKTERRDGMVYAETLITKNGVKTVGCDEVEISDDADELEEKRRLHQALKVSFYRAALPHLERAPEWGAMTGIRPAKVAAKLFEQGKSELQVDEILRDTYFVMPRRRGLAIKAAYEGMRVKKLLSPRDISIYIGIPFCASRCKYCSFVSHSIENARDLIEPYIDALICEMKTISSVVRMRNLRVKTVYFGGGTPTALSTPQLERIMRALREYFDLSEVFEYTVEAGRPDTCDAEKIAMIAREGATRISVNPQTMDDRILQLMGRRHTAEDIVRMARDIRNLSDMTINMDVIAGLPSDSFDGFKKTIDKVIELNPDNITVHTLAIKKGSTLSTNKMQLPCVSEVERMVDFAYDSVTQNAYQPYYLYRQKYMSGNLENVGYARAGFESAYNVLIMEELHSIISLGAGGVTKLVANEKNEIQRVFNPKYPYEYNRAHERFEDTAKAISEFYG